MQPIIEISRRRAALWLSICVVVVSEGACAANAAVPHAPATTEAVRQCLPYQLPGQPGSGRGEIMAIDDAGVYVGRVRDASGVARAAWWTHAGPDPSTGWSLHVPDIPATDSEFLDVNPSGVMSGTSYETDQGFVYNSHTGAFSWLPDFASGHSSWARRINASGVIAGSAADASGTSYAAIWRPPYAAAQRVHVPGESETVRLPNGSRAKGGSEADGINDQGTVVGQTYVSSPDTAVVPSASDTQGSGSDQPLLQGFTKSASGLITRLPAAYDQAYGFAINNASLVVGGSLRDPNAGFFPAYWRDGVEHDIGAPADAVAGQSTNVSQAGWVVGRVALPNTTRSFVWTGAGNMQLNNPLPGYEESYAHGVSDTLRQVAGTSNHPDGNRVPTVWQCPAAFTTG